MQVSEFAGFDLDRSTMRAWSRFQARLADHLAEMGDDDVLVIESEAAEDTEGAAPYVQFAGFGEGTMLRGEVSSNTYLAEQFALGEEGMVALAGLGWSVPTTDVPQPEDEGSANFYVDVPASEADRLAVMAVKALRDVFGVAHPAFLDAGGLGVDPESPPPPAEPGTSEEPLAVTPQTAEHLRDLVDRALTPLFGSVPVHDDDGDIPVPWGSSLVFVRVDDDAPVVELFSMVVQGVTDLERAAFEVGVLNRDFQFLKFLLVEDRVMARIQLPSWPFVPEHLRAMLTGMSARLDEIDDDLVARVGGRRAFEPADEEEDDEETVAVPVSVDHPAGVSDETALMTLLQLDVDGSGTIDPELAAGVCGFDQALVIRLLGETGEQEVAWRSARDSALLVGDAEEAGACAHEMAAWERTTALLRRALRLIVERALGRGTTDSYVPVEPAPARPPRRAAQRRFPRRPAHARVVHDAEGLVRAYKVDDLEDLDDLLTTQSAFSVEVFDLDEEVEVSIAGEAGQLEYPFTLGDFQALLHQLEESAAVAHQVSSEEDS